MRTLYLVTKKNLQILLRSKGSALVIIFAPLLLILLLGLSYNTGSQYGLNIGIYSTDFTQDVTDFASLLEEDGYTVTHYEGSITPCINNIKKGLVHSCIDLPPSLEIKENKQTEITFFVDPSRVNLVWAVQQVVESKFNFKSQEISEGITTNILSSLDKTKIEITAQHDNIKGIKSATNAALGTTNLAKSTLNGLNLSEPSVSPELTKNISTQFENARLKLKTAIGKVEDATFVNASEKTDTLTLLENAKGNFSSDGLNAVLTNLEEAKKKLADAKDAVGKTTGDLDTSSTSLKTSVDSLTTVQGALNGIIADLGGQKVTDANAISSPIVTKIEQVGNEGTFLNYLFPAILVLVIMFSSLLLGTTLVMMEKNSPAVLRNFFLPVNRGIFIVGTYLTTLVLIIVEVAIILGISLFFLKGSLSTLPPVSLILFVAASIFTFLGMSVGYLFTSEETGVLASISLGSLFLFLSGILLPLEGLPIWLRKINSFNPFVVTEKLVREVFLFNSPLSEIWFELAIIATYAIVLFTLIWFLETLIHKHLVNRFRRKYHKHNKLKKELKDSQEAQNKEGTLKKGFFSRFKKEKTESDEKVTKEEPIPETEEEPVKKVTKRKAPSKKPKKKKKIPKKKPVEKITEEPAVEEAQEQKKIETPVQKEPAQGEPQKEEQTEETNSQEPTQEEKEEQKKTKSK